MNTIKRAFDSVRQQWRDYTRGKVPRGLEYSIECDDGTGTVRPVFYDVDTTPGSIALITEKMHQHARVRILATSREHRASMLATIAAVPVTVSARVPFSVLQALAGNGGVS